MPRCTHKYLPRLNKEQGKIRRRKKKKNASEKTWKIIAAVGSEASSSPSPPPLRQISKIDSAICFGFCFGFVLGFLGLEVGENGLGFKQQWLLWWILWKKFQWEISTRAWILSCGMTVLVGWLSFGFLFRSTRVPRGFFFHLNFATLWTSSLWDSSSFTKLES